MTRNYNPETFIYDKHQLVCDRLRKAPPTIVLSNEQGIFVFSHHIEKVHSNILLAGTGETFHPIAVWFRDQLATLSLAWSRNVPRAQSEERLLPPVVGENNSMSERVVYADLVLIELADVPADDFICHVNFRAEQKRFAGGDVVYISYANLKNQLEEAGDDDENSRSVSRELNVLCGSVSPDELKTEKGFAALKERYPAEKGFLKRSQLRSRNFRWIYEHIA